MGYLLLYIAIIFEVIGTTAMKMSNGFTKIIPSIIMIATYIICFTTFTLSLKYNLEVGKAYAIWSGIGTIQLFPYKKLIIHIHNDETKP